jgi:hypothetical protein
LIASPTMLTRTCTITPELAKHILTLNFPKNRAKKPTKIKQYSESMEKNQWELNGETIKFANDGYMHDGQNRTMACIRANVPFTTLVVFGVDAASFNTIDIGKPRDGGDILTSAGYTNTKRRAASLRWLMILESGNIKDRSAIFTPQEILNRQKQLDTDRDDSEFNEAVKASETLWDIDKVFVPSALGALLFLYEKYMPGISQRILHDAARDTGNMKKLKNMLTKIKSSTHRSVEDSVRNAYIILTFNAYCHNKRLTTNSLNWTVADPYPQLPWV